MDYDAIAPDGTPVVYFIGGPIKVKIGYTSSLKMRVNELWKRVGCPLELYAIAYGGRDLEREYHNRFAAHRLHGEWFVHCPEIADEISRLNSIPVNPRSDGNRNTAACYEGTGHLQLGGHGSAWDAFMELGVMSAEEERAAVVAFLMEQSGIANEKAEAAVAPPENERLARDYFAAKISLERAAAAISRGEHLKQEKPDER